MGKIKEFWQLWLSALRLRVAIYLADSKFYAKNERHYVVPSRRKGKLDVWSSSEFKLLRKPMRRAYTDAKGKLIERKVSYFQKNYKHHELMNDCLYFTPSHINNKDGMQAVEKERKRSQWVHHMERTIKGAN